MKFNIFLGLCSRTTCFDDDGNASWMKGSRPHFFNGLAHFTTEFINAAPKWLVLLLGTNDLRTIIRTQAKNRTRLDAYNIARNCANIALKARSLHKMSGCCDEELNIILICPPCVKLCDLARSLGYDQTSQKISYGFQAAFSRICEENDLIYCETDINNSQSLDGVHLTKTANKHLANEVLRSIYSILKPKLSKKLKYIKSEKAKRGSLGIKNITKSNIYKSKDFDDFFNIHSKRRRYDDDELSSDSENPFILKVPRYLRPHNRRKIKRKIQDKAKPLTMTYFRRGRPSKHDLNFRPIGIKIVHEIYEKLERNEILFKNFDQKFKLSATT